MSQNDNNPMEDKFDQVLSQLANFKVLVTSLTAEVKQLKKMANKNNKKQQKKKGGARVVKSGFAKPSPISNELCKFMGVAAGTEVARTEVTKYLTKYIKDHELQNKENRRVINPDSKLTKLLKVNSKDELTYFNLQKYMKHHFVSSKSS